MMISLVTHRKQEGGAGSGGPNPVKEIPALDSVTQILKEKLSAEDFEKLMALTSPKVNRTIADSKINQTIARYIELCKPARVYIFNDSKEDAALIEREALRNKEEFPLGTPGHTVHFDHPEDQGRSVDDTFLLVPKGGKVAGQNCKERGEGLAEITGIMDGIMQKGTGTMYIKFHTIALGERAIPCLEITDSAYVGDSANLIYRLGYSKCTEIGDAGEFFTFVHSAGELNANHVPKNIDKRRVMIDKESETVDSMNTQYAGNSLGMKKLAFRLAIAKSDKDIAAGNPWLCEHMAVFGNKERATYFLIDAPSGCGKTSTAMIEDIVGDDIAILFPSEGRLRAINYESGMFGIIKDVNPGDDRTLYYGVVKAKKVIYSNVLVYAEDPTKPQDDPQFLKCVDPQEIWDFWNGKRQQNLPPLKLRAYWLGKRAYNSDEKMPDQGINHEGKWWVGKPKVVKGGKPVYWNVDRPKLGPDSGLKEGEELMLKDGKPVLADVSHKNARFSMSLDSLPNMDTRLHDPKGVPISAVVSGGRDPYGMPPIVRASEWQDGLFFYYACLESLQTSAAQRKGVGEGKPNFDPGAIKDFLPHSIGRHLKNNLLFYDLLSEKPGFYSTNYFLVDKGHGKFLNPDKNDKKVWFKWAEGLEHHDFRVRETPIGYIPLYEDLAKLFKEIFAPRGEDEKLVGMVKNKEGDAQKTEVAGAKVKETLRQTNPDLNPDTSGSYSIEEYNAQFAIRVPELLAKIDRMIGPEGWYVKTVTDAPKELRERLSAIRERLLKAQRDFGDNITPDKFQILETPALHGS